MESLTHTQPSQSVLYLSNFLFLHHPFPVDGYSVCVCVLLYKMFRLAHKQQNNLWILSFVLHTTIRPFVMRFSIEKPYRNHQLFKWISRFASEKWWCHQRDVYIYINFHVHTQCEMCTCVFAFHSSSKDLDKIYKIALV